MQCLLACSTRWVSQGSRLLLAYRARSLFRKAELSSAYSFGSTMHLFLQGQEQWGSELALCCAPVPRHGASCEDECVAQHPYMVQATAKINQTASPRLAATPNPERACSRKSRRLRGGAPPTQRR